MSVNEDHDMAKNFSEVAFSRGACFAAGTLLRLAKGGWRRIEEIELGDYLELGGRVTGRMEFEARKDDLFTYQSPGATRGIIVAASHAVLEGGAWRRIRNSKGAQAIDEKLWQSLLRPGELSARVYDLDLAMHRLVAWDGDMSIVFSDYSEIDADHPLQQDWEDRLLANLQEELSSRDAQLQ